MDSMILTLLIFLPVFGAVAMLPAAQTMGRENPSIFKWIALVITGLQLLLVFLLYLGRNNRKFPFLRTIATVNIGIVLYYP